MVMTVTSLQEKLPRVYPFKQFEYLSTVRDALAFVIAMEAIESLPPNCLVEKVQEGPHNPSFGACSRSMLAGSLLANKAFPQYSTRIFYDEATGTWHRANQQDPLFVRLDPTKDSERTSITIDELGRRLVQISSKTSGIYREDADAEHVI